jgi:hypothetical protein
MPPPSRVADKEALNTSRRFMPHPLLCVIHGQHESAQVGGQTVCGETGFGGGEPAFFQR